MKKSQLMLKIQNRIEVFENPIFGQIRMVMVDDEPWFVAKDISDKLGYAQTSNMMKRIDDEDFKSSVLDGMNMKSLLINESGLYSAIIGSKLPNAKQFKHWVTSEVLPSIRKHGAYATKDTIDKIISNPDYGIMLLQNLKEEREKREEAERRNAILSHVNKTYTMTEIAKELGLRSANELNKWLSDMHIQYKVNGTWVMYSDYSDKGYEDIKQEVLDSGRVVYHRKITQIGREFIISLFQSRKYA
nr:MAG TPA: repressor domain protein [Caudoviricetes sp.]